MDWDAICNDLSYGHENGLLEIMGSIVSKEIVDDTVEGWLTAEEIVRRVKEIEITKRIKEIIEAN